MFHVQVPSNACLAVKNMYVYYETRRKVEYNARVMNIEKGTFSPIVSEQHYWWNWVEGRPISEKAS